MKVFISADIEGVTGSAHWDETEKSKPDYSEFQEQMTLEVAAACEGALKAGATEIWVKDAHDTGRNIQAKKLPKEAKLVRGWSGHPFCMVQGLDESFSALVLIGYHSRSGANSSPLSHTLSSGLNRITLNGTATSEFMVALFTAANVGVPLTFLSGDAGICKEVENFNPSILTTSVKDGIGDSVISIHPEVATTKIQESVQKSLQRDLKCCKVELPKHFSVEIEYKDHTKAYRNSFYPGMKYDPPCKLRFESDQFFEVLRMFMFVI